jgi:hypothetical protein
MDIKSFTSVKRKIIQEKIIEYKKSCHPSFIVRVKTKMATMAWPCQYINVKLELFTDLSLSSPL